MPRANILLADDVGLGKTIEAGLVVHELMLRHRVRSVLVICPSALQIQWRDQMQAKFGLEFRIVDSELMRDLRRSRGIHANPWSHFPRLISSIDYLKRERPLRLFRELLPAPGQPAFPRKFDLLIVDEAHNIAPSGAGRYARPSLRTQAIRTIAPHFEHRLFLTATPHNGYRESFTALLDVLDNQRFAVGVEPEREQLAAVMVRRMKTEIVDWRGKPRFPRRTLIPLEVEYPEAETAAHAILSRYAELRKAAATERTETFATEFVLKLLKKRLFSSPEAFRLTLEKHRDSVGAGASVGMAQLRRQIEDVDEEFADDDAYDRAESDALEAASRTTRALTHDELAALDQLQRFADRASAQTDEKAKELIAWLETNIRPGGIWTEHRVIIFTEFRATQKWLFELLAARGFARDDRLLLLFGGMPKDKREEIKAAFQARPDQANVRILLATDAASEGIDLQNYCSRLIHYEIPWNPNRLEQRNGRIDRHGQRADKVQIFHFVPAGFDAQDLEGRRPGDLDGDLEFLGRAVHKVQAIREDLGKVGPVIAQQVEDAMLGVRARPLDTRDAERQAEPIKRMLTFERRLQEELERFREQLDETKRELHLAPERVQSAVGAALALAGQPPLIPSQYGGLWPDPTGQRRQCPVFELPALRGAWGRCTVGLEHPHTGERRPIVFDPMLAKGRDDVVLAHLNHPLVDMSLRLLRAEIWKSGDNRTISRVTAQLVSESVLETPAVIGHARLVILGGDGHRLHEELLVAGGRIEQGRFRRMVQDDITQALAATTSDRPAPGFARDVAELWPSLSHNLVRALEVRVNERTRNLEERFAVRAEEEAQRLRTILEELARRIREELRAEPPSQLDLFSPDEREQRERDRNGLETRLAEIPDEIERESQALRARFADPTPHRFDVGVTFLAPESMAR